jgi:hypothetical protein
VPGNVGLEAELGQRAHDVDQAVLDGVFQLRVLAPHDTPADTSHHRGNSLEELPQGQWVAPQRPSREPVEVVAGRLARVPLRGHTLALFGSLGWDRAKHGLRVKRGPWPVNRGSGLPHADSKRKVTRG